MRLHRWPLLAKAAGAGVIMLAAVGFGLLAWHMLRPSDDRTPAVVSKTTTPVPPRDTLVEARDVRSITPTFVSTPPPPTLAPTPTRTPNPSALTIRPCRAEDLVVNMDGSQGAGGNILIAFFVSNVSADTCRVHGAPLPETLDAEGAVLREGTACTSLSAAGDCESTVTVLPPAPVPAPSAGRYEAIFDLSWGNALLFGTPCPGTAASLALLLPDDGGTIVIPDPGIPDCMPTGTSQLNLTPSPTPPMTPR